MDMAGFFWLRPANRLAGKLVLLDLFWGIKRFVLGDQVLEGPYNRLSVGTVL